MTRTVIKDWMGGRFEPEILEGMGLNQYGGIITIVALTLRVGSKSYALGFVSPTDVKVATGLLLGYARETVRCLEDKTYIPQTVYLLSEWVWGQTIPIVPI